MTTPLAMEARKKRLDQRTVAIRKARARLRQRQRQDQLKRQQKMTEIIEAAAAHKLTETSAQALGYILAILVSPPKINPEHAIGALVEARDKFSGPDGSRMHQHYAALARDYLVSKSSRTEINCSEQKRD